MMHLLTQVCELLEDLEIPCFVADFPETPPDLYCVLVPIRDSFAVQGDGFPLDEKQEIRLSLYAKGSYFGAAQQIVTTALEDEITITNREYIGFENETKHHNYCIDLAVLRPLF